jgi:DNA-binding transcriptional LysR family regulator
VVSERSGISATIRHLPYFLAVAEDQHIKHAAARLNMTQSALSRRIQDFEAELGLALFERHPGGVRLTPAGLSLRNDVRRQLADYEQAVHRARRVQRGEEGNLRVAFNAVASHHPELPRWLNQFRTSRPGIELEIFPLESASQMDALMSGRIDVGFLYTPPEDMAEMTSRVAFVHDFILALPQGHRLARHKTLHLRDLANENFIGTPRGTGWGNKAAAAFSRVQASIADRIIAACQQGGLTPNIVAEISSSEARLTLVNAGMGICFVDDLQRGREGPGVVLRKVADFSVPLSISLVWRHDDPSPILANFVDIVTQRSRERKTKSER